MSLPNVGRITAAERAREPRFMHVVAWFDGYGQSHGARPMEYPRRLTSSEGRSWREGWREGWRERRCYADHGFTPCDGGHL